MTNLELQEQLKVGDILKKGFLLYEFLGFEECIESCSNCKGRYIVKYIDMSYTTDLIHLCGSYNGNAGFKIYKKFADIYKDWFFSKEEFEIK